QYLKVRASVDAALSPLKSGGNFLSLLPALASLPEAVSKAHVDALREQSMSIEEYRWISRQLYTTVAGEAGRADADPELREVRRSLEAALRREDGVQIQTETSRSLFDSGLLDYTWLRVQEGTRGIIRQHAHEIADLPNAVIADTVLLTMKG